MTKQEHITEALSSVLLGEKIPFGIEVSTLVSPYRRETKIVAEIPPNKKLTKTILRKLANESPRYWKFIPSGDHGTEVIWKLIATALAD